MRMFIYRYRARQYANFALYRLRIPVGYWAFGNFAEGTPYVKGAEAHLDNAIGWARKNGMKVWVDLHGAPGSQNGKQCESRGFLKHHLITI